MGTVVLRSISLVCSDTQLSVDEQKCPEHHLLQEVAFFNALVDMARILQASP